MSKRTKVSIIFIVLVSALSVWAFVTSSNITKDLNRQQLTQPASDEVSVKELIITETREKTKYWEVYAREGFYDGDEKKVILKDVIGNFYKDNKIVLSFSAPTGTYESSKKEIKLTDGTKVITDNNIILTANQLLWAGTKDEIYAEGNVKMVKDKELITYSDKSVFSTDLTKFKIIGNSKTELYRAN